MCLCKRTCTGSGKFDILNLRLRGSHLVLSRDKPRVLYSYYQCESERGKMALAFQFSKHSLSYDLHELQQN